MPKKKKASTRGIPTTTDLKRLAKAHTKAEDALRHAEERVLIAKKYANKRR